MPEREGVRTRPVSVSSTSRDMQAESVGYQPSRFRST